MKIMIEIECTPEEARSFFGLPAVQEMQSELLTATAARLREALQGTDPEALLKTWMPAGLEGWEKMQQAFWGAGGGKAEKDEG